LTAVEQERGTERARQRRRRLTQDEQREIARLYAEPNASADDIRERYGIGPSTLYRVLSRFGVSRRGNPGTAATSAPQADESGRGRGGARSRTTSTNARGSRNAATAGSSSSGGGGSQRFRVVYRAERVVSARDVRDALRQADQFGASDIFAITPTD
jgi:transposase-like protein